MLTNASHTHNAPSVIKPNQIEWDQTILDKYKGAAPRYTSYPTALELHSNYTNQHFIKAIQKHPDRPLSLYIHIPFCHKLCYYCGCNKLVTRHQHKADEYLDILLDEIVYRSRQLSLSSNQNRQVTQIHLGGGTPTFLTDVQISRLMNSVREHFSVSVDAEISIEVDPRNIELSIIDHLRTEGFNRLSIGVQDFDKEVQVCINREQDESFIADLVDRAKLKGFKSINLDLIYGLPKQSLLTVKNTLDKVLSMKPERLSIFNYAHMPQLFASQRKIKDEWLPSSKERLALFHYIIERLTDAGYQYIGMDHFALPSDPLALHQNKGTLHRNFQGYTTQGSCDLLGLGVSSISQIGDSYAQNEKELKHYYQKVRRFSHAVVKGIELEEDDLIRRDLIQSLMCHFELNIKQFEWKYQISFEEYFSQDLDLLQVFIDDELVEYSDKGLVVSPRGRLLIRHICLCFDRYSRQQARLQCFSRVI
ncbi:oxygen-independent coproporphyrinogen III oxidase [Vibrio sp.]|nr:oxygen-independent coproporphyrinogen III oxidase [Vibrio sp.]